jgi:YD repeat-containing protein
VQRVNHAGVDEPDPTLGTVSTYYTNDILNHLTQVRMPRGSNTQYRTFDYTTNNTVGAFLLSATNPENGTVTYTYNTSGNGIGLVATKTDANGNHFTYTYDTWSRLTQISAGGTVLRTFYYDSNPFDSSTTFNQYASGRLTAVQNAPVAGIHNEFFIEMFAYQQAPAIVEKRLRMSEVVPYVLNNNQYGATIVGDLNASYTYNNEGKVTSVAYPANGPSYTYQFDAMYRSNGLTDQNNSTVVSGVTYGPSNELLTISYPGLSETRSYNSLDQLISLTQNSQTITYTYPAGTNNGKISSQTISGEQVQYLYDSLNRLSLRGRFGVGPDVFIRWFREPDESGALRDGPLVSCDTGRPGDQSSDWVHLRQQRQCISEWRSVL